MKTSFLTRFLWHLSVLHVHRINEIDLQSAEFDLKKKSSEDVCY